VAKWKLNPTRTKMLLGKLVPVRRRYVIATFKTTQTEAEEATTELETYVCECELQNLWPAATADPVAVGPVKRPFSAMTTAPVVSIWDPNKRFAAAPVATSYRPAMVAPRYAAQPVVVATRPAYGVQRYGTPTYGNYAPTRPPAVQTWRPSAPAAVRPPVSYIVRQPAAAAWPRPAAAAWSQPRAVAPRPAWGAPAAYGAPIRPFMARPAYAVAPRPAATWKTW
ncbi:unnamed protein product, partial [Polarella glacialis]